MAGHPDVVQHHLGGVRGADPVLLELLSLGEALSGRRDHEGGLAARAERGVDGGDHDMHVSDAAVGGPGLGAVQDPLVLGLVVDRAGAQRRHVRAGVGLRGAEGGDLDVLRGAEHLRSPGADLLVGAVGQHRDRRERGADDRQAEAGVAPEELLHGHRNADAGGVEVLLGVEVQRVDAQLGGLLDDRPGGLLALVPLGGGRAHHVGGEAVQPVADGELVLAELEREGAHGGLQAMTSNDFRGIKIAPTRVLPRVTWEGVCY